jgi:hypothetical protein
VNPGSRVIVPDDESGDCVFVRAGDAYEALEVDDPAGGSHTREVGLVRYPDGCIKPWPYAKIRIIVDPATRAFPV